MINIAEVMTTDVYTLNPDDTLAQARSLMVEKHIRHIPVVDSEQQLVGLVTHRDLLAAADSALASEGDEQRSRREQSTPVSRVMTMKLASVDENASLRGAALHLQKYKHGCLPVVTDGRLVGIITDSDYVGIAINLLEQLEQIDPVEAEDADLEL
jgi:CBS domain-containing membrane protein